MAVDRTLLSIIHKPVATSGRFDERWYARFDRFVKDIAALEDADAAFTAADTSLDARLDAAEATLAGFGTLPSETTYTVPAAGNPTTYVVSHLYRRQYLENTGRNWIIQPPTQDCSVDLLIVPGIPGTLTFSGGWASSGVGIGDSVAYTGLEVFWVRIARINGYSVYRNTWVNR
jgi:hypothetical protein